MRVMFALLFFSARFHGLHLASSSCLKDPRSYSIDDMEKIVTEVASFKRVPPTVILNRILRKIKQRQRADKTKVVSSLQDLALQELLITKYRPLPPESKVPLNIISPEQLLPPHSIFSPPAFTPQMRRPPVPPIHRIPPSGLMAGVFLPPGISGSSAHVNAFYIPMQNLGPPPGVTVRVETEVKEAMLPEVSVTLSPMMTTVEALKEAEGKYRSFLRQSEDDAVISFRKSSVTECYVIGSVNDVQAGDGGYWKIVVNERTGKEVYQSVCLPSRSEVPIKPGMTITLIYTSSHEHAFY